VKGNFKHRLGRGVGTGRGPGPATRVYGRRGGPDSEFNLVELRWENANKVSKEKGESPQGRQGVKDNPRIA